MDLKKDKVRVAALKSIEKIIGYRFRNKGLLNQALTHKSYANEKGRNKRL